MHKKALFLFRRDVRLVDNTALSAACRSSEQVVLGFIFDPAQTDVSHNAYFSEHAFAFLIQSLAELAHAVEVQGGKLFFFEGTPASVVETLVKKDGVDAVYVNRDYTPFAKRRDSAIAEVLEKHSVPFFEHDDYTLSPIRDVLTNEGKPYSVFTPFFKKASTYPVAEPERGEPRAFYTGALKTQTISLTQFERALQKKLTLPPGRTAGLKAIDALVDLRTYAESRDRLAERGTSFLSPHHKFGTVSIRETYHAMTRHRFDTTQFVSELYWRDFYLAIAHHFPHVFERSFLQWGNKLEWENTEAHFTAWKEGRTGIPVVDAGMRQMNTTGWMHNRARMIVASFLTKNLLIDWRWGEKYFASRLVDYDPASNNGGWQWSASVGADPRPLRIFNPYTQAQKYDPDACYIKRWVPELGTVDSALLTDGKERDFSILAPEYVRPIVSCRETYRRAQEVYARAKKHE